MLVIYLKKMETSTEIDFLLLSHTIYKPCNHSQIRKGANVLNAHYLIASATDNFVYKIVKSIFVLDRFYIV